ncbi:hypothetical protein BAUCODRAFT_33001 [Baudoinia panamericana UAMH 10762]|uniref:Uncharacterized protein n=1 Tax=Baudoinia panamericana (strain UAMH 10762) TaxID=717646 RepID=M2LS12_BAUPA|nr:uncharacterized protein BAUCODRAFT_33001 [Baudoinia panamericana UAMH 10762]EMC97257.1 hypothetical protein BAUCODRAFT_33001 [Baudoinia panamericana UAMH 10762]
MSRIDFVRIREKELGLSENSQSSGSRPLIADEIDAVKSDRQTVHGDARQTTSSTEFNEDA